MPIKNKLAKQMIQKHSLNYIPSPWNKTAIRAIMDFAELTGQHERKAIRALARKAANELRHEKQKFQESNVEFWGVDR